jgi:hypothetical protein
MHRRFSGILILAIGLAFGVIKAAHAGVDNGKGNGGQNNGNQNGRGQNAPELDPSAIGSGIALLGGGMLLLGERRRRNEIKPSEDR